MCSLAQFRLILSNPLDYTLQGSSPWDFFFGQEYWRGLPFPPPGDLPNPGTEPVSPVSLALWADSLLAGPSGKPIGSYLQHSGTSDAVCEI